MWFFCPVFPNKKDKKPHFPKKPLFQKYSFSTPTPHLVWGVKLSLHPQISYLKSLRKSVLVKKKNFAKRPIFQHFFTWDKNGWPKNGSIIGKNIPFDLPCTPPPLRGTKKCVCKQNGVNAI
jgi:hypothetical protein